jgi:hypothetical protein
MENEAQFLIAQQVAAIAFGVFVAGSAHVLYIILRDFINGKK